MLMTNGGSKPANSSQAFAITLLAVAAASIGGVYLARHFSTQSPFVGQVAQEIAGRDIEDKEFRLSDYRGKVVMLDFWGNW